ncbi:hypothetical protein BDF14DRAFT_1454800 [Spinellus fusiger]|nr:hypothetical protein BDF14DRAFT_1454800 [Spinellus fusiger]
MSNNKHSSYHFMMREVRRLRSENNSLLESVHMLKDDLRIERESREISDKCHLKSYNEAIEQQIKLENEVTEKQEQIDVLRDALEEARSSSSSSSSRMSYHDAAYFKKRSEFWGCLEFDSDTEMAPVAKQSTTIETTVSVETYSTEDDKNEMEGCSFQTEEDTNIINSIFEQRENSNTRSANNNSNNGSDEEEEDDDDEADKSMHSDEAKFECLASSHLRQAFVSRLTSARANLELDDLMIKYDPSHPVILRSLASTFIGWLLETVQRANVDTEGTAKLINTRIQTDFLQFWKAILERHIHEEDQQYQFLQQTENTLTASNSKVVIDNFHRLLVMLYKYDIVEAEAITTWWHAQRPETEAIASKLRNVSQKFVEWIDSSDDSDSEDMSDQDTDTDPDLYDGSDCDTLIGQHYDELEPKTDALEADSSQDTLDDLLKQDKDCCSCQFDGDTPPPPQPQPSHTTFPISSHSKPLLPACSCASKCVSDDITTRQKKTVRIWPLRP